MIIREFLTLLGFKSDNKALNGYTKAIGVAVKATAAFTGVVVAMGVSFLKAAGDMEQTEIAFETMLGSAEEADKLIKDITNFAATTPFELKGLVASSKQLLAFGFGADEIINTMTNLGNIAAGVGKDKLPTLISSFGKIRTKGKASMEELNMMLEAGVPILDQLAKNFGVSTQELTKMVSKGKVGFEDVQKALTSLGTGKGGVVNFGGLMEKQSKSFLGILSNIMDVITNLRIAIGKELLPAAKAISKAFLDFLEANKDLIKTKLVEFFKKVAFVVAFLFLFLKELINRIKVFVSGLLDLDAAGDAIWKTFKGVLSILIPIIKFFAGFVKIIFRFKEVVLVLVAALVAYKAVIFAIQLATKAWAAIQTIINLLMTANPIGLIIAGIAALITAIFFLVKNWDKVTKFFKEAWKKVADFFKMIWNGIKAYFVFIWNALVKFIMFYVNIYKTVFFFLRDVFIAVWNAIKTFFIKVWEGIRDFFIMIWEGLVTAVKWYIGLYVKAFLFLKEKIIAVALAVKDIFMNVFNGVKDFFVGVIGFVVGGFNALKDKIFGFFEGIKSKFDKIKEFFGIGGGEETPGGKTEPKPSFGNGGGKSTVNQFSINSNPAVVVPPGTSAEQQTAVKEAAKKAVQDEWSAIMRGTVDGTNNIDFAGGF